jgi:mRNA interferase RelE/StbE
VQIDLNIIISEVKIVDSISSILNLKKLKGTVGQAYRIRCKNYRVCFYYENGTVFFARFLPRKNVYKYFP